MSSFFDSINMKFSGKHVDLSIPRVMGILNVTPDSFYDGGELLLESGRVALDKALQRAEAMQIQGATFIDIGGESTRPGAKEISPEQEMDRVLPLVERIHQNLDVIISIDTSSPELMREGARAGAGLINDVRSLQKPGAMQAASDSGLPVCLMHMQGTPATMQENPAYENIVNEIRLFLEERIASCLNAGMDRDRIIIDPGFGFGKTLAHNLELLGRLEEFKSLELPLLIGLSRKRMLGAITGKNTDERLAAGIAAAVIGVAQGVNIVRTHDVGEAVDALKICLAVKNQGLAKEEQESE